VRDLNREDCCPELEAMVQEALRNLESALFAVSPDAAVQDSVRDLKNELFSDRAESVLHEALRLSAIPLA